MVDRHRGGSGRYLHVVGPLGYSGLRGGPLVVPTRSVASPAVSFVFIFRAGVVVLDLCWIAGVVAECKMHPFLSMLVQKFQPTPPSGDGKLVSGSKVYLRALRFRHMICFSGLNMGFSGQSSG